SILPRSTRTMRPVAVNGFEIDASEYMVFGVDRTFRSRSAHPNASSHTIAPCCATAMDTDTRPESLIKALARLRVGVQRSVCACPTLAAAARHRPNFERVIPV